jgi:hypothetical protein
MPLNGDFIIDDARPTLADTYYQEIVAILLQSLLLLKAANTVIMG